MWIGAVMKPIVKGICCLAFSWAALDAVAQQHDMSADYVRPTDPLVLRNIDEWRDLKFGLFMHWGPYSQWGVVESWSLCPEDQSWTQRSGEFKDDYFGYVKAYENLQTTFNPTRFNPDRWVEAAKYAGMKYMVFTTKHHDGFAMFDTQQSDYRITHPKTPFSVHPHADVTKVLFDAFRNEGFRIGAYFSKPDWHSDDYWWRYFPPKDRNVNYDTQKYPERWGRFKEFTFKQIEELMTNYGEIDILWLDGGQVQPPKQDIDMPHIAHMARSNQPGIIIVDRTVPGPYENYVTPEQQIPEEPLSVPWESNLTMGDSFSYVPNDRYKTSRELIHMLIKIVSRGGNFLLNIAPRPDGEWDEVAYERLREIGDWMAVHGEAIYGTRPLAASTEEGYYYTQRKDGMTSYAFCLSGNGDVLPISMEFTLPQGKTVRHVELLGVGAVDWRVVDGRITVGIPDGAKKLKPLTYAKVLKLQH